MESTPTPQQSLSFEARKEKIAQLQAELQSLPHNDSSRKQKLSDLIELLKAEEELEGEEIAVPEHAYHKSDHQNDFADTVKEEPLFVKIKTDTK